MARPRLIQTMEARLAEVQRQMQERLHENAMRSARALSEMQERMNETLKGSTVKTTQSLTQLQERLATIDKAQENITRLSGDVLSLAGHPVEQADPRRVRGDPAQRYRLEGAARRTATRCRRRCRTAGVPIA